MWNIDKLFQKEEEVFDRLMYWNFTYVLIDWDGECLASNSLLPSITLDILENEFIEDL